MSLSYTSAGAPDRRAPPAQDAPAGAVKSRTPEGRKGWSWEGESSLDLLYQITVFGQEEMQETDHRLKYFSQDELDYMDTMVPVLEAEGLKTDAGRICSCGKKYIVFSCTENLNHDHVEMIFPYRCESRICPRCSRIRGMKVRKEAQLILSPVDKTNNNKFSMLTLTLKHREGQFTPEGLRAFTKYVRKLINHFYPKKRNCGAFSVLEIGPNFNIHAHVLVYGPFISQKKLSEKWLAITGDSYIVDVRIARDQKKALSYITKYLLKPPSFQMPEQYAEFLKALKGVRRLSKYGIFYGVHIEKRYTCKCPLCGASIKYQGKADCKHIDNFIPYWEIEKKECA